MTVTRLRQNSVSPPVLQLNAPGCHSDQ